MYQKPTPNITRQAINFSKQFFSRHQPKVSLLEQKCKLNLLSLSTKTSHWTQVATHCNFTFLWSFNCKIGLKPLFGIQFEKFSSE